MKFLHLKKHFTYINKRKINMKVGLIGILLSATISTILTGCGGTEGPAEDYDTSRKYRLPFEPGIDRLIAQGYGGSHSHTQGGTIDYALDIAMPIGSPVYAARAGRVEDTQDHLTETCGKTTLGTPRPNDSCPGNFIKIEHTRFVPTNGEQASRGIYYHLKQNGVCVSVGQRVKQGDIIGYSGNTGISAAPHLHFEVEPYHSGGSTSAPEFIIPSFVDVDEFGSGIPLESSQYKRYTSNNTVGRVNHCTGQSM